MPPIAWAAAVTMIVDISTIAMNPLDLFRRCGSNHEIA